MCYCWEATAVWNSKVKNILEKRIKIEKYDDEIFLTFYLK